MITIMFAPDVLPCSAVSLIINEKKSNKSYGRHYLARSKNCTRRLL